VVGQVVMLGDERVELIAESADEPKADLLKI
jgi:hypothetical protein